jgi:hypothetical protein
MSPGVRAIMKMPLNAAGFSPKIGKDDPIAPSTLMGSDFFAPAVLAEAMGAVRALDAAAVWAWPWVLALL